MVAPAPISTGCIGVTCTTAQSCTLAPRRITMGPKSARTTALYQTDAPSSTVTSPTSTAVGAMNADGCTWGRFPSKLYSGMRQDLAVSFESVPILRERGREGGLHGVSENRLRRDSDAALALQPGRCASRGRIHRHTAPGV